MTAHSHTPGPWDAHDDVILCSDPNKGIGSVFPCDKRDGGDGYAYGPETAANASLIAAAPDSNAANIAMLAALDETYEIKAIHDDEWIYDALPSSGVARAYFMARAAIAKATQP